MLSSVIFPFLMGSKSMKEAKRVRNFDNNTIQNDKKKKELSKNSHIILPHSLRGG